MGKPSFVFSSDQTRHVIRGFSGSPLTSDNGGSGAMDWCVETPLVLQEIPVGPIELYDDGRIIWNLRLQQSPDSMSALPYGTCDLSKLVPCAEVVPTDPQATSQCAEEV